MRYFLAIDAGGTGTRCWVADSARVLGRAETGTIKLLNVPEATASQRLRDVIERAAADAGVRADRISVSCVGLSGVSVQTTRRWAETKMRQIVSGEVLICGDEAIALDAAFRDGSGVLVIAGTGSHVVGRFADGSHVTAGGWGPVIGDEGSGMWIGIEAIRAGLHARDREEPTAILDAVMSAWGLQELGELIGKANGSPKPAFGELVEVVVGCANRGDAVAVDVLRRAGQELAEQVRLVVKRMMARGESQKRLPEVAFTGSVLAKIPQVYAAFTEALSIAMPGLVVRTEAVQAIEGALWRARLVAGSDAEFDLVAADVSGSQTAV